MKKSTLLQALFLPLFLLGKVSYAQSEDAETKSSIPRLMSSLSQEEISTAHTANLDATSLTILTQGSNDCVINAIASAIECLTTPKTEKFKENSFYPLKISRSGIYTLAKYHGFSSCEEWKAGSTSGWQHDYGVDMGTALTTISKYGCFPESSITLSSGYKISGWEYTRQSESIAPDILRLGTSSRFDGLTPILAEILLQAKVIRKSEICEVENPYAKIRSHLVYEPIERPSHFNSSFYQKMKGFLKENKPIIMGISVTEDFMSRNKCLFKGEGEMKGDLHVVLLLGLGDFGSFKDCCHIQNSWGESWGIGGRGYLSKSYFENNFYGGYVLDLPGFFTES